MKKINFWDIAKKFFEINKFNVATNYPGSKSSKIIDENPNYEYGISLNEKISYEVAYGASLSGSNSVVSIKNVGLSAAADPYLNSVLTGVDKPMLVFVVDDIWVYSSQNMQDSRHFLDFYNAPCFEPRDVKTAPNILLEATLLSQKTRLPVMIRLTNEFLEQDCSDKILEKISRFEEKEELPIKKEYFLTHPRYEKTQRLYLNKRINILLNQNEKSSLNYLKGDKSKELDIVFGATKCESKNDRMVIQTYPIPNKKIKKIADKYAKINVYEEGQAYGYEKLKALLKKPLESFVAPIPDNSHRIFHLNKYEKIFSEINNVSEKKVFGDLNYFSNESTNIYDSILCLGGAIAAAIGSKLAGKKNVFAILGDGALLHSSIISLHEAISKNIDINVIIIDNGGSLSTGGHKFCTPIEKVLQGIKYEKSDFSNLNKKNIQKILGEMLKSKETSVWLINDYEK